MFDQKKPKIYQFNFSFFFPAYFPLRTVPLRRSAPLLPFPSPHDLSTLAWPPPPPSRAHRPHRGDPAGGCSAWADGWPWPWRTTAGPPPGARVRRRRPRPHLRHRCPPGSKVRHGVPYEKRKKTNKKFLLMGREKKIGES